MRRRRRSDVFSSDYEVELIFDPYQQDIEIDTPYFEGVIYLLLEFRGTVSPYDHGRCSGPPELCYPPEGGEVEIDEIRCVTNGFEHLSQTEIEWLLNERDWEGMSNALAEAAMEDDCEPEFDSYLDDDRDYDYPEDDINF